MKHKRVKQNKYEQPIEATLDLHGKYLLEAQVEVVDFLAWAEAEKMKKILIVTGKGLHSENGVGVIKEMAIDILKARGYKFREGKINEGGSGVLVVGL